MRAHTYVTTQRSAFPDDIEMHCSKSWTVFNFFCCPAQHRLCSCHRRPTVWWFHLEVDRLWDSARIRQRLPFTQMTKHCNVQWFPGHIHNTDDLFNRALDGRNHALREQEQWQSDHKFKEWYVRKLGALCKESADQEAHTVTLLATVVFYYPGEWTCSARSWLLALTILSHWWLRAQVYRYLFLLIVYCALVWHSSWWTGNGSQMTQGKSCQCRN